MSNYLTQIAARNNYTENNDLIQPQFHNLFGLKEQQVINPFDNINDSEQIDYSLLNSNTEKTEITPESEPISKKNHENIISKANQKKYISSSESQTSTLDKIKADNTKLFPDKNINNHSTQINLHRSNRNDPGVTDKAYKEKYISGNNVERDIQESDPLNNIRGDIVEKKGSTSNLGSRTETDLQQIKINEPLKVIRTELTNRQVITNESNSNEKTSKSHVQNVVELNPTISQKTLKLLKVIENRNWLLVN